MHTYTFSSAWRQGLVEAGKINAHCQLIQEQRHFGRKKKKKTHLTHVNACKMIKSKKNVTSLLVTWLTDSYLGLIHTGHFGKPFLPGSSVLAGKKKKKRL